MGSAARSSLVGSTTPRVLLYKEARHLRPEAERAARLPPEQVHRTGNVVDQWPPIQAIEVEQATHVIPNKTILRP